MPVVRSHDPVGLGSLGDIVQAGRVVPHDLPFGLHRNGLEADNIVDRVDITPAFGMPEVSRRDDNIVAQRFHDPGDSRIIWVSGNEALTLEVFARTDR